MVSLRPTLLVALLVAILAACASDGPRSRGSSSSATLDLATRLAQPDALLAARLSPKPSGAGFARDEDGAFASPARRDLTGQRTNELGARAGRLATEAVTLGISRVEAAGLETVALEARPVPAQLVDGLLVYGDAYGEGSDLVLSADAASLEALVVVREPTERLRFTWRVRLGAFITAVTPRDDGGLSFISESGRHVLELAPAYALDARGTRRAASLSWDDSTTTLALDLDARGLAFPVLIDPTYETARWERITDVTAVHFAGGAFDSARGQVLYFGGSNALGGLFDRTCLLDARGWACPELVTRPPARAYALMMEDVERKRVVMFGGQAKNGTAGDTWLWDGATWKEVKGGPSPPARVGASFVYDPERKRGLLFGGGGNSGLLDDTWLWDGSTWTAITSGPHPPARSWGQAVWDAERKRVVLFGGMSTVYGGMHDDTWTWDGATWTQMAGAAPAGRAYHAMAYDSARKRVVMYGGEDASAVELGDTWLWDGASWSTTLEPGPPPRVRPHMVYDEARASVVVFGGGRPDQRLGDTWLWDGARWTEHTGTPQPASRAYGTLLYDPRQERVVLAGGLSYAGAALSETMLWDGKAWQAAPSRVNPPGRTWSHMTYDAARGQVLLFGGQTSSTTLGDTWRWDGTAWTRVQGASPSKRTQGGMVYDPAREQALLFGGKDVAALDETWLWSGAAWSRATEGPAPPPRSLPHLAYDSTRKNVVLFGGMGASGALGDTWVWNGATWSPVAGGGPPARQDAVFVDDPARGRVVLYGGRTSGAASAPALGDTWLWDGSAWTELTSSPSPPPRATTQATWDGARQQLVVFGGSVYTFGYEHILDDTWVFDGTWARVGVSGPVPPKRNGGLMVFDAARARVVLTGGTSTVAAVEQTWFWDGVTWLAGVSGSTAPTVANARAVYDEARKELVLHGGAQASTYPSETWRLTAFGATCAATADCAAGACVDGVCCLQSSCAACERCNAPSRPGVCTPILNDIDPDSCAGASTCDGRGACRMKLGGACTSPGDCASGHCVDGACCERACEGQCEACNVAGAEGRCQPVRGKPRGSRPDCEGADLAANVCARPSCDGTLPDRCSGTIGPCAPFACTLAGCTAACASDADCDAKAYCDLGIAVCRPRAVVTPTCDGEHTLVGEDDFRQDCSPYRCEETRCKDRCESVADCAFPFVCSRDGTCVPSSSNPTAVGCSMSPLGVTGGERRWSWLAVGAVSIAVLRRRGASRRAPARRVSWGRHLLASLVVALLLAACGADGSFPSEPRPAEAPSVASRLTTAKRETAEWARLNDPNPFMYATAVFDRDRRQTVRFGGTSGSMSDETWVFEATRGWSQRALTGPRPPGRRHGRLVYDAARRRVVLFGGENTTGSLNDTWLWDGVTWTNATDPATAPPATGQPSMAYHEAAGLAVLFTNQTTWVWDGLAWSQVTTGPTPPPRVAASMVYDVARKRVVLFGGFDSGIESRRGDTWLFDGATWTEATSAANPPGRNYGQLVYDAERERVVLFGGYQNSGPSNDTWTWDGKEWTEVLTTPRPSPRRLAHFAYDPKHKHAVLQGGLNDSTNTYLTDTWVWDGAAWTEQSIPPVSQSTSGAIAYDEEAEAVLIAGGRGSLFYFSDAVRWDGREWTRFPWRGAPLVGAHPKMLYDPSRARMLLVGAPTGGTLGALHWDGVWTSATVGTTNPPGRIGGIVTYDPRRESVVVFGGRTTSGALLADTWLLEGTAWQAGPAGEGPPAREAAHAVYDAARERLVLFGGRGDEGPLGDTWLWDGAAWSEAPAGPTPPPRAEASLVYDAERQRVVLYGGMGATTVLDDTWTWDGAAWSQVTSGPRPPARKGAHMAYDPERKTTLLFGGRLDTAAYGLGDTWVWNGAVWSQVTQTPAPPLRHSANLAWDADRKRLVLWGGRGLNNDLNDTWTWDGTSWSEAAAPDAPPQAWNQAETPQMAYDEARHEMLLFAPLFRSLYALRFHGNGCASSSDCLLGACVDGVCCAQASCASCERCDGPETPGRCTLVTGADDPDTCGGTSFCDDQARCRKALGQPCASPLECASGSCADGVCCSEACAGQCEACNKPGAVGLCQPVRGKPRGPRQDCDGVEAATDVCARPACDGATRTHCAGTIGPCTPYACATEGCKDGCESDADCDPTASCDLVSARCRPRREEPSLCDGDHTLAEGTSSPARDCSPYRCEGSSCKERCTSVRDCAYPFECDRAGACVPPSLNAAPVEAGCAAAPGPRSSGDGAVGLALAAAVALARRARRAGRASSLRWRGARSCGARS